MSFSKDNNNNNSPPRTPWVQVVVPTEESEGNNNEFDLLVNRNSLTLDDANDQEPTAEATIFVVEEDNGANENKELKENYQMEQTRVAERPEDYPKAVVVASATAGGILGCLVGGIGCAVLGAFGSLYAAKHKAGSCVGDCARAMGEVAITVKEKAVELDEKHHIVTSTKNVAEKTLANAQAVDTEYRVAERSKNCILSTGKAAMDFTVRHRIVERSAEAAGRGLTYVGSRIRATESSRASVSGATNGGENQ